MQRYRININAIASPVVLMNRHLRGFLRIVPKTLIHHIEKCVSTPVPSKTAGTIMWKSVLVPPPPFVRPVKPFKCPCESRGAIIMLFAMVLTNCCYQIDPSHRKVCWYPHAIKLLHHIENCASTPMLSNCSII